MSVDFKKGRSDEKVRLKDLKTDGRFNRPIGEAWVDYIISSFAESAFGTITVSKRADKSLVIIDGQHRVAALRKLGVPEDKAIVPATVYAGLTLAQEAQLFFDTNKTKNVSAYQKFRALLTAGDEECRYIKRQVEKFDLRIGEDNRDGVITGVSMLHRVYRMSQPRGRLLDPMLRVVTRAWGSFSDALRHQVLEGVARYLHNHPDVDQVELSKRLAELAGGPSGLIGRAKVIRGPSPSLSIPDAISQVIEKDVMKKRRRQLRSA